VSIRVYPWFVFFVTMKLYAHISIHDVAPDTLEPVSRMLGVLKDLGVSQVMLLVIPGLPWTEDQIGQLRRWADEGHLLAGHGKVHHVNSPETLYHKAHSFFISRNVAEHLSRTEEEIAELMQENWDWFSDHGLPPPSHYVPPAWALGDISRERLRDLPFETVEVLRGVIEVGTGRLHRSPLLGFEADTLLRAWFLRGFNAWNRIRAGWSGRCARISLHPQDLNLKLADRIAVECRCFDLVADASELIR
jgi:predicted deacetylase